MSEFVPELLDPAGEETLIHQQNNRLIKQSFEAVGSQTGLFYENFRQDDWTSFTPALTADVTDPTLGTGATLAGAWARFSDRLFCIRYVIRFGTAGISAGSGNYFVSFPEQMGAVIAGSGFAHDDSTLSAYNLHLRGWDADRMILMQAAASPMTTVTDASPITWAVSDYVLIGGVVCLAAS